MQTSRKGFIHMDVHGIKCVMSKIRIKNLCPSIRKELSKLWINSTTKFHAATIISKIDMHARHGRRTMVHFFLGKCCRTCMSKHVSFLFEKSDSKTPKPTLLQINYFQLKRNKLQYLKKNTPKERSCLPQLRPGVAK